MLGFAVMCTQIFDVHYNNISNMELIFLEGEMDIKKISYFLMFACLAACSGGGGGGGDQPSPAQPSPPPPPIVDAQECAIDFSSALAKSQQLSSKGGAVAHKNSANTALFVSTVNHSISDDTLYFLASGSIDTTAPSQTGRYVAYSTASNQVFSIFDQSTGAWRGPISTLVSNGGEISWSGNDTFFVWKNITAGSSPSVSYYIFTVDDIFTSTGMANSVGPLISDYFGDIDWSENESTVVIHSNQKISAFSNSGVLLYQNDLSLDVSKQFYTGYTKISSDGRYLSYIIDSIGDVKSLYIQDLSTNSIPVLIASGDFSSPVSSKGFWNISWSKDSSYLAVKVPNGSSDANLLVYNAVDNLLSTVLEGGEPINTIDFLWAKEGVQLVFNGVIDDSDKQMLYLINPSVSFDAKRLSLEVPTSNEVEDFAWSDDSKYVAFVAKINSGELYVADINNTCFMKVADPSLNNFFFDPLGALGNRFISWSGSGRYLAYSLGREDGSGYIQNDRYIALDLTNGQEMELKPTMRDLSTDWVGTFDWFPASDVLFYATHNSISGPVKSLNGMFPDTATRRVISNNGPVLIGILQRVQ